MELADLVTEVRAELGKVSNTTDIADADIQRESLHILQRINSEIPKKTIRSITSVADQREYPVATTTVRVREVIPASSIANIDELEENLTEGYTEDDYNFPSLWVIKNMRRARSLPNIRWEFNPVTKLLALDPVPTEGGVKHYYISMEDSVWTIADVPAEFNEMVIAGTVWKCLMIVFLRRSTEGGILRDGGRVDYPASALKAFADSFKESFFEDLDVKRRVYSL